MAVFSRRDFLAGAAGALLGAGVWRSRSAAQPAEPRIVVVGAGLAGMTSALRIWQKSGVVPAVFEAGDRIGGRTRTIRSLPNGLIAEAGGTFISTGDRAVRSLADELHIPLIDLNKIYPGGRGTFHLRGKRRGGSAVFADERPTERTASRQFDRMLWPSTFDHANAANLRWDGMSVAEWIEGFTPHGLDSIYGAYLRVYFETEFGGSIEDASAIHLIADYAVPGRSYDERFQVRGGSDRIVRDIEESLPTGVVQRSTPLTRLARVGDGTYQLTFSGVDGETDVVADHVVLALPFSALKDVDLSDAGFSERKSAAIEQLGMGQNSKLNLVFERSTWSPTYNGESITDLVIGGTWPGQPGQAGPQWIIVGLNGAGFQSRYSDEPVHGRLSSALADEHLEAIGKILPDAPSAFIEGEAYIDHWPQDPWVKGSYSYYPIGGFTSYAGVERKREGNIHFAGEHTRPYGDRGTMNGAVAVGREGGEIVAGRSLGMVSTLRSVRNRPCNDAALGNELGLTLTEALIEL